MSAAPGVRGERRDADGLLLAGSAAGCLVIALFLVSDGGRVARSPRGPERVVARLIRAEPGVLRRPAGTLVWDAARAGEPLSAHDSLYVPSAASASVFFDAGPRLEIEERSLVVIEPPEPEAGALLKLSRGSLSGSAVAGRVTVRTPGGQAVLDAGSDARIGAREAAGPRVEVAEGSARSERGEVVRAAARIRLDLPARNQRFYFSSFPASVPLRWDGTTARGTRLEVARDRDFAMLVDRAPGSPGAHAFRPAAPGQYYWRLVDQEGAPQSEVRRLLAVVDRPPKPFFPMAAEILLAPPDVAVPFWWTAVDGAVRYQLQLSADPSFATVAFASEADGPGVWVAPQLPEGVYFWRVRATGEGRDDAPFSTPSPFRLIHRSLPDAPQLFDPSIEVVHGDAR